VSAAEFDAANHTDSTCNNFGSTQKKTAVPPLIPWWRPNYAMKVELNNSDIEHIIAATVSKTVAELVESGLLGRSGASRKLACTEAEAARMLGLHTHQLRDERREGKIQASQIRGRRIRYTEQDLLHYLAGRRYEPE